MDFGPVTICGEVTILHGGFLLASRLCHPKPLSELAKSDWSLVGQPILEALREICSSSSSYPPQPHAWKKKATVVLWSKILFSEASSPAASVNQRWKDDVFFAASNMIPEVNRTVLFELLKEVNAPRLFTQLLLVLPGRVCRRELQTFVDYVAKETSPGDVSFFLDVWWEMMKHKEGQEDRLTLLFRTVSHQHFAEPDEMGHAPKRFKSETSSAESALATSVLPVLKEGFKRIKDSIAPARLKCYALANLVDMLSILIATECETESLPARVYLDKISSVVSLWSSDCENRYNRRGLEEKVREAARSASLLGVDKLSDEALLADLGFLRTLLQEWTQELQQLLSDPRQICYESYRLLDSLASLEKKLRRLATSDDFSKDTAQAMLELGELLAGFLKKISPGLSHVASSRDLAASVAMALIDHRMERHEEMCSVFASETNWALTKDWLACLLRNRELFQEPGLILKLLETTVAASRSARASESQAQQAEAARFILDCYRDLSLGDKNKVIAGVLAAWGRRGLSGTLAVFAEGFQEELNRAFNQIILSASGEGFRKSVASVSQLMLLNPEATIKKISNLAVANLGTHHFLAEILCSFPALNFRDSPDTTLGLLLGCLKETVWDRLSSAKEQEQFLEFLAVLMQPSGAQPLLSPAEVTQHLVVPFLTSDSPRVELSLQVLGKALGGPSERSWVHTCHPFPLIFSLCKLLDGFTHFWHEPPGRHKPSLETKDLVASSLARLSDALLSQKDSLSPELWNQSVAWLHKKASGLDWTAGLRLRSIYGDHFKNEVPATLFEVCQLPEDEWAPLALPSYGAGSGLLAWMECCCVSAALREQMLAALAVNVDHPEEVNLFSKGFLLALVQVLPWCSQTEWKGLTHVIRSLLQREVLHVPYSLEYVHHLPLLNFRPFAHPLRFSVLLLRVFQLLCGSSGAAWLPAEAWRHVVRLYSRSLSDLLGSLKGTAQGQGADEGDTTRERCFVHVQVFCHTLHVAAMLPDDGTGEPLVLLALEILAQYEALSEADESLGSALRRANEGHFLGSIAENVTNKELRSLLLRKLQKP